MKQVKLTFWSRLGIVVVCAMSVVFAVRYAWIQSSAVRTQAPDPNAWKADGIRASFVGMQVRELNSANSVIVFYFDLENTSTADFRLANGSNLIVMSRLKSDGSLSSENHPRLEDSVFIPAKNRTRIAISFTRPFAWPASSESVDAGVRQFAAQSVENLEGFVLFDQLNHAQIELPGSWQKLREAANSPRTH